MSDETKLENRLKRACAAINKVLADTRQLYPNACLYLDGTGNLNLMSGPHHDDSANSDRHATAVTPRPDRIICYARLNADGGDW